MRALNMNFDKIKIQRLFVSLFVSTVILFSNISASSHDTLETRPHLNRDIILPESILLPAWTSWQSEHYLLSVTQGTIDFFAISAIIGEFIHPIRDAGAGIPTLFGLGLLGINRLIGCPLNLYLATNYNEYLLGSPYGHPSPQDNKFHAGVNSTLGLGGFPFAFGLTGQHENWRTKIQLGMFLTEYAQDIPFQPAIIAEMSSPIEINSDYRLTLNKVLRLRPGIECRFNKMRIYRYPDETIKPEQWIYEIAPRIGIELVPWSRFSLEASIGYTVMRSQALQSFLEDEDRLNIYTDNKVESSSRWMIQVAANVWVY